MQLHVVDLDIDRTVFILPVLPVSSYTQALLEKLPNLQVSIVSDMFVL